MPKRKWKTRQTVGQQHAAIREKNRFKAEIAEGEKSVARGKSTLKAMEGWKGVGEALKKLGPAKKEMDKLKEQRKFKQRKEIL